MTIQRLKNIAKNSYRTRAYYYKSFRTIIDDVFIIMNNLGIEQSNRYIIFPYIVGSIIRKDEIEINVSGMVDGIKIIFSHDLDKCDDLIMCITGHEYEDYYLLTVPVMVG